MPTTENFTIHIVVSQYGLDVDGQTSLNGDSEIQIDVSQPSLSVTTTSTGYPTQDAIITFGHWFKGDKGDDGKSAYEIWLEEGHTGTEEDFLEWLKEDGAYIVNFKNQNNEIICENDISEISEAIIERRHIVGMYGRYVSGQGGNLRITDNIYVSYNVNGGFNDMLFDFFTMRGRNYGRLIILMSSDGTCTSDSFNYFTSWEREKLDGIESGAQRNVQSDWGEDDPESDAYILHKPNIPSVNDGTLTIQKNGSQIGYFSANTDKDEIINIRVPTSAADVNALPASTAYGASLSLTMNSSTYVLTARLKDQNGNNLGTAQTVDLPLESVVVNGTYDSKFKRIVLTLQNGNTIYIPVGDLISGLQSEITAQNPLSADLLIDGTDNKVFTAEEQTKLENIESGAEVNVQSDWNQTDLSADDFIKNKPTIPYAINDLSDVDITSATNQNVLMYDSVSSKWKNATIPSGVTSLSELSDVDLTSLANGQMLKYNSESSKWENVDIPSDAFICTFTQTNDSQTEEPVISCDKTVAEIIAAANEGKVVLGKALEETETSFISLNFIYNDIVIFGGLLTTPFGNSIALMYGVHNSSTDTDVWNVESTVLASVATSGSYSDLSNKPTLGTAAALDVAESGNASSTQVVKGDDTRLTDSRPASDVSAWAKESTKPSYTASEVGAVPTTQKGANGGVAELDSNGKVPSSQLPSYVDDVLEYASQSAFPATGESGKIYIALDTNKTYRWGGSAYVEISESLALGETSSTAYAGNKGKANADAIAAIKDGTSIDSFGDVETALADKISKSSTAGLVKNDGTIDTNTYLTQHQDISGKADKVANAINGNFAALDSNGNLTDSGSKASDFLTQHQDISGKANKSEMSVVDGTGSDADKTTITLKTGTSATVLKSHQDISGKQDVIDSSHKLSADLIVDGTTNKVINVKPDWNAASGADAEILNKPTIPAAQVNSDWNASSGIAQILNKPIIPSAINDLSDVTVSSPTNGQVLKYNSTSQKFENATDAGGATITLRTWTNS